MTDRLLYHSVLLRDGSIELRRSWSPDGTASLLATTSADSALRVLQREYALRSRLNASWAAMPVNISCRASQTQLRLNDPGGIALRDLCRRHLSFGQILAISSSIAAAVAAMHAAGIVHRDISPDNILFDLEYERSFLTGFGNARDSTTHGKRNVDQDVWITSYAYLPPELSGRINRLADSRSDLYSIGCVLYELVTGTPAFPDTDIQDAVHSHLARIPPAIHTVRADVPAVFSDIVARLIAKDPNDRYAGADGLLSDIERCRLELQRTGAIEPFPLDHAGVAHRLFASGQLYGRDEEAHSLATAFERIAEHGGTGTVLLTGPSGSGKSALAWHLHASLIRHAHVFATGKCGEVEAAVPYGCVIDAMNGLLRNSLRQGESEFRVVRQRLRTALGTGAQVFASLLPDLRFFIDELEQADSLPAQLEKERVFEMVRRFLACFATERTPLVLFIDDLQWVDSGSSAVIEFLRDKGQIDHLLLVCATRNSSASSASNASNASNPAYEIALRPLPVETISTLIVAAFGCRPDYGDVLARLVHVKTEGSPFFVIRFLAALLSEGLIWFDRNEFAWHWNIAGIRRKGYTANVADLLLTRVESQHGDCLLVMQSLACLGDRSSLAILSLATGRREDDLRAALDAAEEAQLVISDDTGYAFAHDRIREAVYGALKRNDAHKVAHAEIGRRLSARYELEPSRALLFIAARQINLGEYVPADHERVRFASINLQAGIDAKRSTDYPSALGYLGFASKLASGTRDSMMQTLIEFHTAECEFMTGQLADAEQRLRALVLPWDNIALRADVARLRCALYTTTGQLSRAIEVGLEFLGERGIHFPHDASDHDVTRIRRQLIESIDATEAQGTKIGTQLADVNWSSVMDVLSDLIPPALMSSNARLGHCIKFTFARVTLEHGCCGSSGYGLVCAASALVDGFRDPDRGLRLGEWALELNGHKGLDRLAARVSMVFGVCVMPWVCAVRDCQPFIREATVRAYEDCDLTFSVYCRRNMVSNMLFAGTPLDETALAVEEALEFAERAGFRMMSDAILAQLMLISTLRGSCERTFASKGLNLSWSDNLVYGAAKTSTGAYAYWVHKLQIAVLFRHWTDALEFEQHAARLLPASAGHLEEADLPLYGALARATAYVSESNPERRKVHLSTLRKYCGILNRYAESCPANFTDRAVLAQAELARIEGRTTEAQQLYDKAIDHACNQGFLHIEALAYETAAHFYASINHLAVSEIFLHNARYAYLSFSAEAKVHDVSSRLPRREDSVAATLALEGIRTRMDTGAVVIASRALSSEMILPRLLEVLVRTMMEHVRAMRCFVALQVRGELRIEAQADTASSSEVSVTLASRELTETDIPAGMLSTIDRTHQTILLNDAATSAEYRDDPVVIQRCLRSVLCLPLLKRASLIGILYVENSRIAGAFTTEETRLLEVLAAQAAISIENARLYAEAIESNNCRERAEMALRNSREELARVSRLTTMGQLVASIAHEVTHPLVSITANARSALRWMDHDQPNLAEIADAVERIQGDSSRANEIVRGLRALGKRSSLNFSTFDLNEAIRDGLLLTHSQIDKHRIKLVTDGLCGLCLTRGDRVQIQQVILNLIVNAIEAMEAITDRDRLLTLATRHIDSEVILSVEDTGTGIAANVIDKVFLPFVTTKPNRMGMGLSICASIVEMHKGRLTANNRSPFGTRFEAILPGPRAN